MAFLDNNLLLYVFIIIVFIGFFLWNGKKTKKNRQDQKDRNFRKRYHEKKSKRGW